MVKRVCVVSLWWASVAQAGTSFIELVPDRPGPYEPGASVYVDVLLHNMEGQEIAPRLMTLDFSATDPGLDLPPTFTFVRTCYDFNCGAYTAFETLPKVDLVYWQASPAPGFILTWPDGEALPLGGLTVGLPDDLGTYVLDAVNRDAPDMNTGARIDYGWDDERVTLHWLSGGLAGGQLAMEVVPEPATIVLLGIGCSTLALSRRPRSQLRGRS